MSNTPNERPIGGFLGLEFPAGPGGLRRIWGASEPSLSFVNARSAFASLVKAAPSPRVWFPAFICPEFVDAVPEQKRRYYPVGENLSPIVSVLETKVRPGDLVLAVDYFGRPPGAAFLDYVAGNGDVIFVEDCAQAMNTAEQPWGSWRLFSPRKLVGVPDGGLLVRCSPAAAAITPSPSTTIDAREATDLAAPQLTRFEDENEVHNDVWHRLNQEKERRLSVSTQRMSRLTWTLLGLLEPEKIGDIRRRNFAVLADRLREWALFKERAPQFVPLGFPVLLERRQQVRELLHKHRIFPAVHWERLPSPRDEFPAEHALASRILTLPCDHRYNVADMERVITLFLQAAA
jgi:dTDP-4-amino-4,6-dideoxygalactose transaminase